MLNPLIKKYRYHSDQQEKNPEYLPLSSSEWASQNLATDHN
jgi:hypothetical protein